MAWRVATCLNVLLNQINSVAPNRNKASDGSIGDARHASRASDHNPHVKYNGVGIVTARDFTHDPANGADMHKLADALVASNDPRIKYIIWNRRIYNPSIARRWRPYSGSNPHTRHLHLSVRPEPHLFDSSRPWNLPGFTGKASAATPSPAKTPSNASRGFVPPKREDLMQRMPIVRRGQRGYAVRRVQALLLAAYHKIKVDGIFGPDTERQVKEFQAHRKLTADGVVGPQTWTALIGS